MRACPVGVATQYASMLLEAPRRRIGDGPDEAFRAGLTPTAGDIQTFYAANRAALHRSRTARAAHRHASAPTRSPSVVPTEQEIAAYYNANRATYGGREVRVISQAVVPTKQAADAIAAARAVGRDLRRRRRARGAQRRGRQRRPADPPAIRQPRRRQGRCRGIRGGARRRSSARSSRTSAGTSSASTRFAAKPAAPSPTRAAKSSPS